MFRTVPTVLSPLPPRRADLSEFSRKVNRRALRIWLHLDVNSFSSRPVRGQASHSGLEQHCFEVCLPFRCPHDTDLRCTGPPHPTGTDVWSEKCSSAWNTSQ